MIKTLKIFSTHESGKNITIGVKMKGCPVSAESFGCGHL